MIEQWMEIDPIDTLFFRGGEPMVAGETHEAGRPVFPPRPETIIGALRTAILSQKGINPDKLKEGEDLSKKELPFWGTPEKSGFWIAGPLFKVQHVVLFPAPATWFFKEPEDDVDFSERLLIYEATPFEGNLPIRLSTSKLLWVRNPAENMESMSGVFWLTRKALENNGSFELDVECNLKSLSNEKPQTVLGHLLFKVEERVGIARDNLLRAAKEGHLYAARHIRLERGVSLIIGVDKPLYPSHLKREGFFQLGGEGRLVKYRFLENEEFPPFPRANNGRFLAISHLSYERARSSGLLNGFYASGKLVRYAGFDMKRRFHKPVTTYFPAGAVFFSDKTPGLCELVPF